MKNFKLFLLPAAVFITLYFNGCAGSAPTDELQFISREGWNALPPKPYNSHVPERITVHHEGTKFDSSKGSPGNFLARVQKWGMGPDRNWADIPYHYILDYSGIVYEGRNVYTVGETGTDYDPTGHLLISLIGNFEVEETKEPQIRTLVKMLAMNCEKFNIPVDSIRTHRDYAKTSCPGKNVYALFENGYIQGEVRKLLSQGQ